MQTPEPWRPEENDAPQAESRPQRSEWMRILLYAVISMLIQVGHNMVYAQATQSILNHVDMLTVPIGVALYWVSIAMMVGFALLKVIVNKWLVFRSKQRWWVCMPLMLAGMLLWRIVSYLIQHAMIAAISDTTDTLMMMPNISAFLTLAEMIVFYVYQRFVIFRNTLDTL